MTELFNTLAKEWPMISEAPYSFAVSSLAIVIATWIVVHWSYKTRFASRAEQISAKNSQIELLSRQIADLQDKAKAIPVGQSSNKIEELRVGLDEIQRTIHSDDEVNAIYQGNRKIGSARDINVVKKIKRVTFGTMEVDHSWRDTRAIRFREFTLAFDNCERIEDGAVFRTYRNAQFSIVSES